MILNDRSDLTLVNDASFQPDQRLNNDALLSISDLYSLAAGQMVKLRCHVTRVFDETTHKTRSGNEISRQEVTICDETDTIKLILYGNDVSSLKEGKSYIVKNVRMNAFKDKVFLNTTIEKNFEF